MKKFLFLLGLLISTTALAVPNNTMSITTPTDREIIEASDETTRYNEITTKYNAHHHTIVSADITDSTIVSADINSSVDYFVDRGNTASDDFNQTTLTTDGTWRDLDLSSIVPAGAKAVLLKVQLADDAANNYISFRNNGHADTGNASVQYTQVANIQSFADMIVACDTNRVIEYYGSNTTFTTIGIVVRGWWL